MSIEALEQEPNDLTNPEDEGPKIELYNILNGVFYLAGVTVVCLCEFTTIIGGRSLSQALAKHATILSGSHESWDRIFLVWISIFVFEAIFVLAQFGPFRDHEIVKAISFWWIIQCMLQIAYFILLMLDFLPIWITAGLLIANFAILLLIIARVEFSGKRTFMQSWCLRVPFSVHAGYLLCESIAWLNVLLQVRNNNADGVVIATSMTGITSILTLTTVLAMAVPRPDGFFCAGVAYTYYFVALELLCEDGDTMCYANLRVNLPDNVVSDATLQAFHYAALSICFIAGCLTFLAFGLRLAACCQRGRV